jgi:hypothetical protein
VTSDFRESRFVEIRREIEAKTRGSFSSWQVDGVVRT